MHDVYDKRIKCNNLICESSAICNLSKKKGKILSISTHTATSFKGVVIPSVLAQVQEALAY